MGRFAVIRVIQARKSRLRYSVIRAISEQAPMIPPASARKSTGLLPAPMSSAENADNIGQCRRTKLKQERKH